ncbi:2OG-Fe(II) oxygenase family oxidoreductase [Gloeomargarita lithophora Alchichica-D10]|uniref:2OG-Fe(II) oxygenase family oxidoreductase n=2 Tax=Gloeomargarita TaxID=1188227 RepID=A0A1J0ADE0_9CYAN|nr:2OG-Fe(II) oxygenase family oxidoreductase [Gloeomargarita lithophora Alchichica-D10]
MVVRATVPILDLQDFTQGTAAQRQGFIQDMGQALEHTGFFILVRPGIDSEILTPAYDQIQALFALPLGQKQQYEKPELLGQRGYVSFGKEHAKGHSLPDLKEFWHLGRMDNLWPQELPEFAPALTRLYQELDTCAAHLLQAASLYLALPADFLPELVRGGSTILRLIHYPPVPEDAPPGAVRAAPHEDINLITLLCGATTAGLELYQRDGTWLPVPVIPGGIVVDSGDMLQWLTNGLFCSTTHRVVNPIGSNESRYSVPFFVHPRPEVDLTPRFECVTRTGGVPRFGAITATSYLQQRLREIGIAPPV